MDKFSAVALSTCLESWHTRTVFTVLSRRSFWASAKSTRFLWKNYIVYSLTRYSLEMFLWVTNNVTFVNSAVENVWTFVTVTWGHVYQASFWVVVLRTSWFGKEKTDRVRRKTLLFGFVITLRTKDCGH